jgi:hypothetical protein
MTRQYVTDRIDNLSATLESLSVCIASKKDHVSPLQLRTWRKSHAQIKKRIEEYKTILKSLPS